MKIRIGTWNLKNFGGYNTFYDNLRLNLFSSVIQKSNLDIIVFQECTRPSLISSLKHSINKKQNIYNCTPYKVSGYRPFNGKHKKKQPEYFCCFYNKDKFKLDNMVMMSSMQFKSTPVLVNLQLLLNPKISCSVLNVHLQYIPKKNSKRKELSELYKLLRQDKTLKIQKSEIDIKNIIVAGDMNHPGRRLKRSNLPKMGKFKTAMYNNKTFIPTNVSSKNKACYDHIFYSTNNDFWKFDSIETVDPSTFKLKNKFISDHRPVIANFYLRK